MRTFKDSAGRPWQAALLDASYGSIRLVFSPLGEDALRQCPSGAGTLAEALGWLEAKDDDALRALLETAEIWDPASGE